MYFFPGTLHEMSPHAAVHFPLSAASSLGGVGWSCSLSLSFSHETSDRHPLGTSISARMEQVLDHICSPKGADVRLWESRRPQGDLVPSVDCPVDDLQVRCDILEPVTGGPFQCCLQMPCGSLPERISPRECCWVEFGSTPSGPSVSSPLPSVCS